MTQRKTYKDRLRARILDNTGFSTNTAAEASRLSNRDGSYNVRKTGMPLWERYSAMHTLLRMKTRHFIMLAFGYYFLLKWGVRALIFSFVELFSIMIYPGIQCVLSSGLGV